MDISNGWNDLSSLTCSLIIAQVKAQSKKERMTLQKIKKSLRRGDRQKLYCCITRGKKFNFSTFLFGLQQRRKISTPLRGFESRPKIETKIEDEGRKEGRTLSTFTARRDGQTVKLLGYLWTRRSVFDPVRSWRPLLGQGSRFFSLTDSSFFIFSASSFLLSSWAVLDFVVLSCPSRFVRLSRLVLSGSQVGLSWLLFFHDLIPTSVIDQGNQLVESFFIHTKMRSSFIFRSENTLRGQNLITADFCYI